MSMYACIFDMISLKNLLNVSFTRFHSHRRQILVYRVKYGRTVCIMQRLPFSLLSCDCHIITSNDSRCYHVKVRRFMYTRARRFYVMCMCGYIAVYSYDYKPSRKMSCFLRMIFRRGVDLLKSIAFRLKNKFLIFFILVNNT